MRNFRKNNLRFLLVLPLLIPALPLEGLQAAPAAPKKCIALRDAATPAEADAYAIRFGPSSNADLLHVRALTTQENTRPPASLEESEEIITPDLNPPASWNCKPLKTYKVTLADEAALKQQPTLPRPPQGTEKSSLVFDAIPALPGLPADDTVAKKFLTDVQTGLSPQLMYGDAVWNAPSVREARQQLRPELQTLLEEWRAASLQADPARVSAVAAKMEKVAEASSAAEKQKVSNFFRAGEEAFRKTVLGPSLQPTPQTEAHYQALYRNQVVGLLPTLNAAQRKQTADLYRKVLAHYKNLDLQVTITLVPENLTGISADQQAQIVNYNKALQKDLLAVGAAKYQVRFITDPS